MASRGEPKAHIPHAPEAAYSRLHDIANQRPRCLIQGIPARKVRLGLETNACLRHTPPLIRKVFSTNQVAAVSSSIKCMVTGNCNRRNCKHYTRSLGGQHVNLDIMT